MKAANDEGVGKAGFPLYEHRPDAVHVLRLLEEPTSKHKAIRALRLFAGQLEHIEQKVTGTANQLAAFELIRRNRPYCLLRLDGAGRYSLVDRDYQDMTGIGLTAQDLQDLRLPEWLQCGQSPLAWTHGTYPVIDDGFRMSWLAEGAGLVQAIADRMEMRLSID